MGDSVGASTGREGGAPRFAGRRRGAAGQRRHAFRGYCFGPAWNTIIRVTLAEKIAQLTAALPVERQHEVLDFVEFLRAREPSNTTRTTERVAGLFSGLPYSMADDFDAPLPEEFWSGEAT